MKIKKGFTIIEMMVAMAVLSMLVVAMSRIFQQSLVATDTGYNLVKGTLVGRTIMQYVAEDLSSCTSWTGEDQGKFKFERVFMTTESGASSWQNVTYYLNSGKMQRKTDSGNNYVSMFEPSTEKTVEIVDFNISPNDPLNPEYLDVFLSVNVKKYKDATVDEIDTKNFATRVYLQNNNRYKYGKYSEL
jgi:prepilin-type N-terminal cleavage/methylation domain-containing protein